MDLTKTVSADPSSRDSSTSAAAEGWRESAAVARGTIAALSRANLELFALGAPLDVVKRTHLACVDAADHSRLCLDVATALDGNSALLHACDAVDAPPARGAHLQRILDKAIADEAIPATLAAAEAEVAAGRATHLAARAALERIVDVEARRAALAWDVVAWARGQGAVVDRGAVERACAAALGRPSARGARGVRAPRRAHRGAREGRGARPRARQDLARVIA
jgi:hypothetical protein